MGDLGARMLSKALQINNKLKAIYWDKNNTTSQGFEDVADALEKNFTLRKMPMPVFDASVNPERNEQALQRIERLLQRNHSPQKYSSDQAYRLQQGFLISSTQQMVDRLVVQSQDTINALESMNALQPCSGDIDVAKALIKDADNSKTLLPRLRDIAIQSQNTSSPVAAKLKEISEELKKVLESQMKKTVQDMLDAASNQCKALMKDEKFLLDLQSGCVEKSSLPKDFTSNILNDVDTDIFNELSELNLAVAAHVSDQLIEEVIERLSFSHKTLTNHLNERKKDAGRRSQVTESKKEDQNEANLRSKSPQDSPKMKDKRKSMHARKIRPQSVIDRDHVQLALDADRKRPTTVPQATRSGSRSPKNRSQKPLNAKDRSQENEHLNTVKTPLVTPRSLKPDSRSPSVSPRSTSPVPSISVTYTDVGDLGTGQEHIYDNAVPQSRHRKHRGDKRDLQDGLEGPGPNIQSKPLPASATLPDLQNIELNPEAPKLTHVNKDRARRPKNVRPTTRQSGMPRTRSENTIKVDENVEDFFSKPSTPSLTSVSEKKEETPSKSSSTKSTPESKKKMGGIFNFGHKDKEQKDTKAKESKKGGLLSRLHGSSSPKSSPSPKHTRISDVQEEPEDSSNNNNALSRSSKEKPSPRGSMDKKSEKPKNEPTASLPKTAAENVSLSGSLGKKSDKSDSISEKSVESLSLSTKSDKSNSLDRKSDKSGDKSPVIVEENKSEDNEDSDKSESGSSSESEPEEDTKKESSKEMENGDVKKEVKTPLQPPRTKRSFSKADAKKETATNETVKDNAEEKENTKAEKESKETEETNDKNKEEVKEESKAEAESEKDKEESDKVDETKPLSVPRKPGMPGGIGFGVNIMADLKAKQEKRRSQMPSKPTASDKTESQSSATEEKKSPFGLHSLKPVSKTVPKENNNLPVKPSDNKSSDTVKTAADVPLKSRAGSGSSDTKTVTPPPKADVKVTKNNSIKDSAADKPSVTPRPGLNKPPPPTRPKPPVASSKPTPAPRKSLSSSESTENVRYRHSYEDDKKPAESGVVYDSATLKMSVKDKISKFKSPGNESEAGKGKSLSQSEKKHDVVLRDSKKNDSLPSDTQEISHKRSSSLPRNTTPSDMKKGETTEAGDLDIRKVQDAMTDSGIGDDSPKTSVKDALSKFDSNDVGLRKHGSLPRQGKQIDSLKENSDSPKRPQSMFAALGNRAESKKHVDNKEEIAEENDQDPATEEILV
ncbi:F-actin-uncapping protein LRRC16A-like isoform X3 [Ruditapes philippinarum]|uniref:F-actin-uncapping protein LRRC16A-like isoform X3 n=1 Tax=Ruditapes philippinarum TaxID=129788 RepID=UPI00295A7765|nr:F-actin-uncapping protein LRRC16A-like isoform X3 [Ruditapes philippinarum]